MCAIKFGNLNIASRCCCHQITLWFGHDNESSVLREVGITLTMLLVNETNQMIQFL